MIGSRVAMALAMIMMSSQQVDASLYQEVGVGMCQPEQSGEQYNYLVRNRVVGHYACSAACDEANGGGEIMQFHRGFSVVRQKLRGDPDSGFKRNACLCFYDRDHLPENSEDAWFRHDGEMGEGSVYTSDQSPGVQCYQMLVEKSVAATSEVPDTSWGEGYKKRP